MIFVFQSVPLSSKRHKSLPPLEIVVQGLADPGACATRQPAGKGTAQLWEGSPFPIPKLQDCSVVAVDSWTGWAEANPAERKSDPVITEKRRKSGHIRSMAHPSTELFARVNRGCSSQGLRAAAIITPC